jgi:hypothetical protein
MTWRTPATEPTLDELLGDAIMIPVARSAGLDLAELRRRTVSLAQRMARAASSGAATDPAFTSVLLA